MHIWTKRNWEKVLPCSDIRSGLRLRFDASVDPDVKNACLKFAKWLRKTYCFPLRVPIYVKSKRVLKTIDGEGAVGTFFEPYDYSFEPYIRIATGDYIELKNSIGKDNALATIIESLSHELTHYFQWINGLQHTPEGSELQAAKCARYIVDEYAMTCDHP